MGPHIIRHMGPKNNMRSHMSNLISKSNFADRVEISSFNNILSVNILKQSKL